MSGPGRIHTKSHQYAPGGSSGTSEEQISGRLASARPSPRHVFHPGGGETRSPHAGPAHKSPPMGGGSTGHACDLFSLPHICTHTHTHIHTHTHAHTPTHTHTYTHTQLKRITKKSWR